MGATCNPAGSYPGDPAWSLIAALNPACLFASYGAPVAVTSLTNINEATCTSGTAEEQATCQAAVLAAQQQAMADPAYCCGTSSWPSLCALGLTNDNCGVSSTSGLLALLALGIGTAVLVGAFK